MSDTINYGGQAVIEGVMMRSPRFFSVACRRRNGEIFVRTEPVPAFFTRYAWARWPFMRGVFALADAMVLGMKALLWSANIAAEDEGVGGSGVRGQGSERQELADPELTPDPTLLTPAVLTPDPSRTGSISGLVVSGSMFVGLAIGIALFVLMPSVVVGWLPKVGSSLGRNLLEGGLRVALFLGYIKLIGRMAHVKRLFGYHGAEHKAINGLELEGIADVGAAAHQSTIHPRCGTNFVIIVLLVKVLLASFFGWPSLWLRLLIRLAVLPVTAALAFEVLRLAGKYRHVRWVQWVVAPGLWTQRLTTREPDLSMLEVAVQSLESVMAREQEAPALLADKQPAGVR